MTNVIFSFDTEDIIIKFEDFLRYLGFRDLHFAIELKEDLAAETIEMLERFNMKDKAINESLRMLDNGKCEFIFTTVKNNPRAASAEEVLQKAKAAGKSGTAENDIGRAYELALSRGVLTVICGSLYLYSDLMEYLRGKQENK